MPVEKYRGFTIVSPGSMGRAVEFQHDGSPEQFHGWADSVAKAKRLIDDIQGGALPDSKTLPQGRHSPLVIELMFACYYSPEPWANARGWTSPAGREGLERLLREGLITPDFSATERGRDWVDALCSTPLPSMVRKDELEAIQRNPNALVAPADYVGTPEQWAEDMRKERD